jgi:hypothetical protein
MKSPSYIRPLLIVIPLVWMFILLMTVARQAPNGAQLVAQAEEQPPPRQPQPSAGMTEQQMKILDKFVQHEARFKDHYQAHFSTSHYEYNQYRPSYLHGFELALDPRYRKTDWNNVEPQARRTWDESTMGLWTQYKDAVRYGWEQGTLLERE